MADENTGKTVKDFLDVLASAAPAPGGGAVAALAGALGAALVSMVSNLTLGKKDYVAVQARIGELGERSEALRGRLTGLVEEDYSAFMHLSAALKMPRSTDDEKAARTTAVQSALKTAAQVPLQIAEACAQVMQLCMPVAEIGNKNAVSDAGVAILMAEAGLRSAALNVLINLGLIRDQAFVDEMRLRLETLMQGTAAQRDDVYQYVVSRL